MREKKQISLTEEFQIIYVDTPLSKRWSKAINPEAWATLKHLLPEYSIERGGNTFTLEETNKHYVIEVIEININCDKSKVDSMYP